MLRSEFYRELEQARKLNDAEKAVLRERIVHIESERAREEGRRIQIENQLGIISTDLTTTRKNAADRVAEAERAMKAAREEMELSLVSIDRLEKELAATRGALAEVTVESSVLVFDDIFFAAGKKEVAREDMDRLKEKMDLLRSADQISIVGYTDDREPGFGFDLGSARASAVAGFLRSELFVASRKINVLSRGSEDPKELNTSAESRARNRRVEIIALWKPRPRSE